MIPAATVGVVAAITVVPTDTPAAAVISKASAEAEEIVARTAVVHGGMTSTGTVAERKKRLAHIPLNVPATEKSGSIVASPIRTFQMTSILMISIPQFFGT